MEKNKHKIIHDINNHLTSLGMSAELLLKNVYGDLNAKQKQRVKGVVSDGKKIQKLIEKLRD